MTTQEQINSFHIFATQQVQSGSDNLSVVELFDLWQVQDLTSSEIGASTAAVKAALDDMENGDCGRPFDEIINEMRNRSRADAGE